MNHVTDAVWARVIKIEPRREFCLGYTERLLLLANVVNTTAIVGSINPTEGPTPTSEAWAIPT
jgi:hypothetical protein